VALNLLELRPARPHGHPKARHARPERPGRGVGPDAGAVAPASHDIGPRRRRRPGAEAIARLRQVGEEHYNLISALHKSMRNSDPDASIYWLARMLESGEDPLTWRGGSCASASEDVGNADRRRSSSRWPPRDAAHFLGMPEANTALAQAAVYLATAPRATPSTPLRAGVAGRVAGRCRAVPLHLRNAPTRLMKDLEYGKGYRYAHDEGDAVTEMECLPRRCADGATTSRPGAGSRRKSKRRLDGWAEISGSERKQRATSRLFRL